MTTMMNCWSDDRVIKQLHFQLYSLIMQKKIDPISHPIYLNPRHLAKRGTFGDFLRSLFLPKVMTAPPIQDYPETPPLTRQNRHLSDFPPPNNLVSPAMHHNQMQSLFANNINTNNQNLLNGGRHYRNQEGTSSHTVPIPVPIPSENHAQGETYYIICSAKIN